MNRVFTALEKTQICQKHNLILLACETRTRVSNMASILLNTAQSCQEGLRTTMVAQRYRDRNGEAPQQGGDCSLVIPMTD
jgi:hypothetical protein